MNICIKGQTEEIEARRQECEDYIYNIEEGEGTFDENRKKIIDFLKSQDCGMGLGLSLRHYMCKKYAKPIYAADENGKKVITGFTFTLDNGKVITVSNYIVAGYDVKKTEVSEYADVFMHINGKYNFDNMSGINRQEARRLLRITDEVVRRDKLFKICFALHLDKDESHEFLTKYLCERTYNYRQAAEAIAAFCFATLVEENNYSRYLRILNEYESRKSEEHESKAISQSYTVYATAVFEREIDTEEELLDFLLTHKEYLEIHPQTALREYKLMYEAIKETMGLSNPEQVAKAVLDFIPRENRGGGDDFVSIANSGPDATNDLPNAVISNPMLSDRILDLLNGKISVDRKDLVFMKFFLTSLEVNDILDDDFWERKYNGRYNASVARQIFYNRFTTECNHVLEVSGFSPLSPLNKYENLILLSMASDAPFEMFGDIVESSFF